MQYTTEILIKKPISEVIEKLDSSENLKHWQNGLVSTEHISGQPSELGATMKLSYSFGKRKMEIIETVTKQNFPYEYHASYTTKGVRNIQENYFKVTEENYTYWISKNEFQPTSFKMSAMLFFMPRAFKKQTKTYLTNFKNFVENGISVLSTN
ncbi:SRPBCC family protein [Winogradskyella litoriviva]|uniref:SRPBCC family protein n=1 Tax=Winogradskyella litoriviva TaxID=1220182 RepID=A0ABX2E2U7_9FLAO|nr:SRPBCC family protein [Winogradskyella litoriviva]NRD22417.1 SRPBCC family protein [Winogradskyella litoriviva]